MATKRELVMEINDEQLNQVGEIADTLDNLLAASTLPMSAQFHLNQLRAGMKDASRQLKQIVTKVGGLNPWEG
jgi:hypothetical protein